MTEIKLTTLDNGLRVITDNVNAVQSIALGVWINAGSRREHVDNNGTAHFLEHMLFKGTKTRDAKQIVSEIESVGGQMNAYTSRDITSYHMHLMAEHTDRAMDVLADMMLNSTLPPEEVERERSVILQEIGMTHDTPDDLIFDLAQSTAYPDQSFGRPILGPESIIEAMDRGTLQKFVKNNYTPEEMVISASGQVNHDSFVDLADSLFKDLKPGQVDEQQSAEYKGGDCRENKELEQTHVIMGFDGLARDHDDFYTAQMLGAILGGGMSSRLFQEVREKRGLAYSIYAYHGGYADTGAFGIYAGTAPDKTSELIHVLCDEALSAIDTLRETEINRAKHQMKSALVMGRESMMTRANGHAKYLLQRGKLFDEDTIVQAIDGVDSAALSRVAKQIFTSTPTLTTLGDIKDVPAFEDVKKRLAA